MAGDWLKFESSTPEKREVLAITLELGFDDPDLTVGKLLRVWRWFDQQTVNGNAVSVTPALLDRLIGVTGITQAMANVGWMLINAEGLLLPNFDRHNGKTAKNRALTAKRVANFKGNAGIVSEALPREEKRREEVKAIGDCKKTESFDEFWKAYPKKKNKGDAEKSWGKLKPDTDLQNKIFKSLELLTASEDWKKQGGQFIPYPASWLNAKGWEDEVQSTSKPQSADPAEGQVRTFNGEAQTFYNLVGWVADGRASA